MYVIVTKPAKSFEEPGNISETDWHVYVCIHENYANNSQESAVWNRVLDQVNKDKTQLKKVLNSELNVSNVLEGVTLYVVRPDEMQVD